MKLKLNFQSYHEHISQSPLPTTLFRYEIPGSIPLQQRGQGVAIECKERENPIYQTAIDDVTAEQVYCTIDDVFEPSNGTVHNQLGPNSHYNSAIISQRNQYYDIPVIPARSKEATEHAIVHDGANSTA